MFHHRTQEYIPAVLIVKPVPALLALRLQFTVSPISIWSDFIAPIILTTVRSILIRPSVSALPHFTQIPSNLTAWEGDVVSIQCEAKGLPTPTTFWILEGNHDSLLFPECTKSNSSLLYLDGARAEHNGRVICTAVNAAGSTMHEAYLTVLSKENDLREQPSSHDSGIDYERDVHMTEYELVQARKYLKQNVLVMKRVEALSSTSLKVVWDVSFVMY